MGVIVIVGGMLKVQLLFKMRGNDKKVLEKREHGKMKQLLP